MYVVHNCGPEKKYSQYPYIQKTRWHLILHIDLKVFKPPGLYKFIQLYTGFCFISMAEVSVKLSVHRWHRFRLPSGSFDALEACVRRFVGNPDDLLTRPFIFDIGFFDDVIFEQCFSKISYQLCVLQMWSQNPDTTQREQIYVRILQVWTPGY